MTAVIRHCEATDAMSAAAITHSPAFSNRHARGVSDPSSRFELVHKQKEATLIHSTTHSFIQYYSLIINRMTSIGILPQSLETALHELVKRVNACDGGIKVILLSTSEGVPLGRIPSNDNDMDESVLSSLESTWAPAPKQLSLLKRKRIQRVTAMYENVTLMQFYYSPVVVTLVVTQNSNLGAIQSTAIPLLETTISPLCQTLLNSLSPSSDGEWQDNHDSGFYQ